jgi:hypothetical protein
MELAKAKFLKLIETKFVCVLCHNLTITSLAGTQSCRFHPSDFCETHDIPSCQFCFDRGKLTTLFVVKGCTRIDHCESIEKLMQKPYFVVPIEFISLVEVATQRKCSRVLVTKPSQLQKQLVVVIEPMRQAVGYDVLAIYEEMAAQLGLPSIEDEVREARMYDPVSRASKYSDQFGHGDAPRKDRLRASIKVTVAMVPFYIFAKVGSVRLRDIKEKTTT